MKYTCLHSQVGIFQLQFNRKYVCQVVLQHYVIAGRNGSILTMFYQRVHAPLANTFEEILGLFQIQVTAYYTFSAFKAFFIGEQRANYCLLGLPFVMLL